MNHCADDRMKKDLLPAPKPALISSEIYSTSASDFSSECVANKFAQQIYMCGSGRLSRAIRYIKRNTEEFRNDKLKNKQGRRVVAKAHAKVKQMRRLRRLLLAACF